MKIEMRYHVVTRAVNPANLSGPEIEKVLNDTEREGWEYVSLTVETLSNQIIYVFKQIHQVKTPSLGLLPHQRIARASRGSQ